MIKWYDAKDRPVRSGWYVEQESDLECYTFPDIDYQIGWNTRYIPNVRNEVYFRTHLNVVFVGYRIHYNTVYFAVQEQYTFSKNLPYVVVELEQTYATALFNDLLRAKKQLDSERAAPAPAWAYWYDLSGIRVLRSRMKTMLPQVVNFGTTALSMHEEYKRAADVAAQHGYTIDFSDEGRIDSIKAL